MVKSMTGFGRASSEEGSSRNFVVETKSVNHRFLDINIRMPKNMISLEERIRAVINEKLNRGKVDLFINYKNYGKVEGVANLNKSIADSYMKCLAEIKSSYDIKDDISVSLVSRFPDVIYIEEKEENLDEIWQQLLPLINIALDKLISMREREGIRLKEDIISKCNIIKKDLDTIEKLSSKVVEEYKAKLEERIKVLTQDIKIDESRLSMEVAIFADKSSIDEEITRLNSHIAQVMSTLSLNEPIGRKLDFIVQEMNREANTIASKASYIEITNTVLNIKNEIEKIREQVQNIE